MSTERDILAQHATQLGIKVHHKAKAETIKALIEQHEMNKPQMQHPATMPREAVVHNNSADEIKEAIQRYVKEGFVTTIDEKAGTWHFAYKGAEDSGNVHMPLRVIAMKAEMVSKGRRGLRTMGRDPRDPTYSGNILSA